MSRKTDCAAKLSYWQGYLAGVYALRSVVSDIDTLSYIDTVIIPKTRSTLHECENTYNAYREGE